MKKAILGMIIAMSAAAIFAADPISSYTKTDYTITTKFGDYFRAPSAKFVHTVDANGLEIEVSEYTPKDVLQNKLTYQYDSAKKLVSSVYTDANNNVAWKTMCVYNATGKLEEESELDKDNKLTGKTIYKYEKSKTDESYYNGEGILLSKKITKFDTTGRVSEAAEYFGDGTLDEMQIYSYTDNGAIAQIESFIANSTPNGKLVYRYSNNVLTEVQQYDNTGTLIERAIYKNNDSGRPVKISTYLVAEKFGSTMNELTAISEFEYK